MTHTDQSSTFPDELQFTSLDLSTLKSQLAAFQDWSLQQFQQGKAVEMLVLARSHYIDALLRQLWQHFALDSSILALIAVGGYGRQELHPLSDIDLLILSETSLSASHSQRISQLLRFLWDLHLDVGHSVRTLDECLYEAAQDLTVMTNLIESRLIIGQTSLLQQLRQTLFGKQIWPSADFYRAKVAEQQQRHQQYHGTSYNLEPDIKNSPGGLRDIQTIQWIAIRHFGGVSIKELQQFNYLTPEEMEELKNCHRFLWRLRFALHSVISRYDNRLLFDRQLSIAKLLGYPGDNNRAVERMMHDYYRVVHNITELNQMLLQLFEETILALHPDNKPKALDKHFQLRDDLIDVIDPQLFIREPAQIMRLFYAMLHYPQVRGIYSRTLRQLRIARRKLTQLLSAYPQARQDFMAILQHPTPMKALLPMHQHSILAAYIPGWKQITGLMQFDLFHAYTVDEHIIRVLQEIVNYQTAAGKKRHPNSARVFAELPKPHLLFIAVLFHDIAKGQHGDHSELGAQQAQQFCQLHAIATADTELVMWLVKQHLLMSLTAQRRDIQDPLVIKTFAQQVKNQNRLNYLLCLTVADICATNENLWNSWKQSLIRELYFATQHVLKMGIHHIPAQRSLVRQHKQDALALLQQQQISAAMVTPLWQRCRFDYFLRYNAEQIAWHTQSLLNHPPQQALVLINPKLHYGGTEIFIYAADRPYLFAAVSSEIEARNLSIHAASIITTRDGYVLDTFIVLDPNGQPVSQDRHHDIQQSLLKMLAASTLQLKRCPRPSAKLRHFQVPTQVKFLSPLSERRTYVELIALDRPGLLARIAEVFASLELSLSSARIVTIGEHVEDLFILTDKDNHALSDTKCNQLHQALVQAIDAMAQ